MSNEEMKTVTPSATAWHNTNHWIIQVFKVHVGWSFFVCFVIKLYIKMKKMIPPQKKVEEMLLIAPRWPAVV